MFIGLISFALALLLAMTAIMLSTCVSSPYDEPPPNPKDAVKPYIRQQKIDSPRRQAQATKNEGVGRKESASSCLTELSGTWRHPTGGAWTFDGGNRSTIVLDSINYGSAAQQITELSLISCGGGSMSYKIVRAALINTVDPSMAYDKTPANAPTAPNWSKTYNQPYSIVGNTLKVGNFNYTKD